jgi:hypothetical protein
LFGFYEDRPFLGTILTLLGVLGLSAMVILLKGHRLNLIHTAIAALLCTWVLFGYDFWFAPRTTVVHGAPSANDIAKATAPIVAERDAANRRADNLADQLVSARQDAAAARAQLAASQQQQSAQIDRLGFPPFPIKKRKLTHSEAIELIDKLNEFSELFKSLENPMSARIFKLGAPILSPQQRPLGLDQAKEIASDVEKQLREFDAVLLQKVSGAADFRTEIDQMLGGQGWFIHNSLGSLIQSLDNYVTAATSVLNRPDKPDGELAGLLMRDSQNKLLQPMTQFNLWRNEVTSTRIQELQNEARGDL